MQSLAYFRNTKLREVFLPGQKLRGATFTHKPWPEEFDARPRTIVVLDRGDGEADKAADMQMTKLGLPTQDLPMLMWPAGRKLTDPLGGVGVKELQTLYYQIHGHNSCFMSIALLQMFFGLLPQDTPIRIRHGPQRDSALPKSYITTIHHRRIVEVTLLLPKHSNFIMIVPDDITHVNGEDASMVHAAMGFYREESEGIDSLLDLGSLQFGDRGRGPGAKGKALFALDTPDEFNERIHEVAEGRIEEEQRISHRVGPGPDDESLGEVAKKVKERWDRRATEKWCGHCGRALPKPLACSKCHKAWYCGADHQRMSWSFHKHHCSG